MTSSTGISRGPKIYRVGVFLFSAMLTVLLIWLGNFVLNDIKRVPAPDISDTQLLEQQKKLTNDIKKLDANIKKQEAQRKTRQQRTQSAQQTLTQLIELQKARLSKNAPISAEEQQAFSESQRIFLQNQMAVQKLIDGIESLQDKRSSTQDELNGVRRKIDDLRKPIIKRHARILAFFQFLFLAPFVLAGCWLVAKRRSSNYASMIYAFNAATFFLLVETIHRYFPARYYKYMFIILAIGMVVAALVLLIRQFTHPSVRWLLQRYKEAYHSATCPVCRYPIVGENMQSLVPHKSTLKKRVMTQTTERGVSWEYVCPSCGTQLFEKCEQCSELRHSLLPNCMHCGNRKENVPME
ncbi:MAG: hypothetical protein J7M12_00840 [Candidatus Hydrogenedentes bacterium]|nr:hypothetical protein [Candidatus Hydrogenedentota bacterium]